MSSGSRMLILLVLSLAFAGLSVHANSDASCANDCSCPNKQSCTNGAAKSSCCWDDAANKCNKVSLATDSNNCGTCGNQCNTATSFGRVCVNGQCQCGGVGQPCCQDYLAGSGYGNGCKGNSGLGSGCPTANVGCDAATCTCKCVDAPGFTGFLPDFRQNPQCP